MQLPTPHTWPFPLPHPNLLCLAFLLQGCERPVSSPDTPADEILLIVDSLIAPPQVQVITQALGAPVDYLGRLETPMRVTPRQHVSEALLRSAATLVVVRATEAVTGIDDPLRTLPPTALAEHQTFDDGGGAGGWSTYENGFLVDQTIVTARISSAATSAQAARLGRHIRNSLENSQIHHRSRRFRAAAGASLLPQQTTRGSFRLLVPPGFAWSDTAMGWPHSVQIAATRPTRVVTVFWLEDAADSWMQSPEFLVGMLRDAMWRLQRDRLDEGSVVWLAASHDSPELQAIWQNPDRIAGGPLRVRFFFDAARQRLYGVQALVFLPGNDKHGALRDAVAIASTFEIVEPF
jgi:hypothetical protein